MRALLLALALCALAPAAAPALTWHGFERSYALRGPAARELRARLGGYRPQLSTCRAFPARKAACTGWVWLGEDYAEATFHFRRGPGGALRLTSFSFAI